MLSVVMIRSLRWCLITALVTAVAPAWAAQGAPAVSGADLPLVAALPFVGLLLSIAVLPLATPSFWRHHYGKVAAAWAVVPFVPFMVADGIDVAAYELLHVALLDYIPFLILIGTLFTVSGGVRLRGNLHGNPATNTAILGAGTFIASLTGTTGAAMLLVHPVIRANDARRHNSHVLVFFIFLVANIGGSLTPLGDPPLFLGFLKGVSFFWPTVHLFLPMLATTAIVLAVFFLVDTYLYRREVGLPPRPDATPDSRLGIDGWANIGLLGCVLLVVLISGIWKPDLSFEVYHVDIELQNLTRDLLLLIIAYVSWARTSRENRQANGFSWGPIVEVAKLFAGIFVTIIPVTAILRAGEHGALAGIVRLVTDANGQPINAMYFWLSGGLSSFLDNAPTYMVFFNIAGGDAGQLMGQLAGTLAAISAGSVFMGANTYIGNAPNFMVKAVAEKAGIKMPSFFGYMAWSTAVLIPTFVLVTLVFFTA
ncbi:MAG: sodium:proton antiporter [Alphaproteobacteria bacterium]|nr:sodium:proton antiporter [Alphaproteobacteria bacterium]